MNDTTTSPQQQYLDETRRANLANTAHDQYLAQAHHFFSTWAEKLRMLDETRAELATARSDLDQAKAAITEKQIYNTQIEGLLRESRAREARALEDIGVLKGIMQTHGASIADVVSRIGIDQPAAPANGGEIRRVRSDPQ